jgi:sterol 24-C-methyltransferase
MFCGHRGFRESFARYLELQNAAAPLRVRNSAELANNYYNVASLFYELGWGESFHFASRWKNESRAEAIRRVEYQVALILGLGPGQTVLDVGCGIGGPMRNIARFAGCRVLGVNQNEGQVTRCRALNKAYHLADLCEVIQADMLRIPIPDKQMDAAYAIEATVHVPLKDVYTEVYRILKPGGMFYSIEWVLLDRFDEKNPFHFEKRRAIEIGNGIAMLPTIKDVLGAARSSDFEVLHSHIADERKDIPWYAPLLPRLLSVEELRHSLLVQKSSQLLLRLLGFCGFLPREAAAVSGILQAGASGLVQAGQAGIFTPSFCILCRKTG